MRCPCIRLTVACVFWKVIEEIEEMMQESPDPEDDEALTQSDRLSMLSQEIQTLKRSSTSSYEESKRPSLTRCSLCFSVHLTRAVAVLAVFDAQGWVARPSPLSTNARACFDQGLGHGHL